MSTNAWAEYIKAFFDKFIDKIREVGQHSSGALKEKEMELLLGSKTLWTFEFKSTKDWKFISSLNLLEVPGISAKWSFEENFLPNVDSQILTNNKNDNPNINILMSENIRQKRLKIFEYFDPYTCHLIFNKYSSFKNKGNKW